VNNLRLVGLAVLVFVAGAATCAPTEPLSPEGTTTTIILIRHAERDPGLDPPLNAEGLQRREALRAVLAERGVTAIYCTDLIRNRQTVEPLAEDLGLTPVLVNPALYVDTVAAANQVLRGIFNNHAGGTVLFCGNIGSTLGAPGINESLYNALGGDDDPPIRYQDLYVIVVPDEGDTHIVKAEYGGVSSLD
jgi:hypothetical protein